MQILDLTQLLMLAVLWSSSFLFLRIAAPVLGPIWLIEFRVLIASLVLLPILSRLGLLYEIRRNLKLLFILGLINSAIPFSLFAFSAISLPSGFNSILNATTPLFGIIVASLWLQEKFSKIRVVGFILGFVGVIILISPKVSAETPEFFGAILAGLLGASMYAIAAVYIKQRLAAVSPLAITTGSQLCAALILLPGLPLTIPQKIPTAIVILSVLALALFSSVWAYLLYFRLIKNIGATKTLTVAYLIPLFSILWGAILLQETVTFSMLLGCSLILLGTAIANDFLLIILSKQDKI
jgi:drug/metabolite transporter (DMT)-like permease